MMSTFGVDREQIEWVATGFMLTSAVVMPFVGWLTNRINYKALYLGALLVFTVASAACAMAWSYESLIAARILQAMGGGAIQPIGMAIVAELFEPHERGRALGIWGMGIMAGPAIGPTLGGYLTDAYSWRTIFSVNLPVGVLTLLAGMIIMRPIRAQRRAGGLSTCMVTFSYRWRSSPGSPRSPTGRSRAGTPITFTSARRSPSWAW